MGLFDNDKPKLILRPYQQEAVDAIYHHLRTRDDSPCCVIPTAGGKTAIMATLCRDTVKQWKGRILILAHVKELLEQASKSLAEVAPDIEDSIGIYSAGLGRRDSSHPIILGGIQSVYRKAPELDAFDIIMVDECHLIPPDGEGMYQTFLNDARVINPNVRLIGLTATPYRMSSGMVCAPENLLNHVCYEIGVKELIAQGFLCPLHTKAGSRKVDRASIQMRGGEFVAGAVEDAMDDKVLVQSACNEIVQWTQDRHSVLIFAAGVDHATHIQRALAGMGQECGFVCGETLPFERASTLSRFKARKLKYLVNVNVLTTGFDAPNIDCVAMLRPTMSPGLYYQMVGRGFRLFPGKADCLVLDFSGNIVTHGPVDCIEIKDKVKGDGPPPAKECPQCHAIIAAGYGTCPECGFVFPPPEKSQHEGQATDAQILSGVVEDTRMEVSHTTYELYHKKNQDPENPKPPTMMVKYQISMWQWKREWICVEHSGYARMKAERWWGKRSKEPCPSTVEEAVALAQNGALAATKAITVRSISGEEYDSIVDYELGPVPEPEVFTQDDGPQPWRPDDNVGEVDPYRAAGIDLDDIPF